MNKKVSLIIVTVIVFLLQAFLLNKLGDGYSFLLGVPITASSNVFYRLLIYWYLPISFVTFLFIGETRYSLRTSGVLLITRGRSRLRWWGVNLVKTVLKLGSLILIQYVIFKFIAQKGHISVSPSDVEACIRYFLMLLFFIVLQMLLELFIEPTSAHLIVNTAIVGSVLVAHICYFYFLKGDSYWLFVPINGMQANVTGMPDAVGIRLISSEKALLVLLSIHLLLLISSLIKVRKLDIF